MVPAQVLYPTARWNREPLLNEKGVFALQTVRCRLGGKTPCSHMERHFQALHSKSEQLEAAQILAEWWCVHDAAISPQSVKTTLETNCGVWTYVASE